jgi:hypothetical protein
MKTIKLIGITLFLGSSLLLATDDIFVQSKEIIVGHLNTKMDFTKTFKTCVEESKTRKVVKTCQGAYKESMKTLRTETKEKQIALTK